MLLWKQTLPAQWYFSFAKNLQGCAGCALPGIKVPDVFGTFIITYFRLNKRWELLFSPSTSPSFL